MAEPLLNRTLMSSQIHVSNTSQAGFTLVEMMMTVAVFAILAGAAVPQLSDMSGQMRLKQGLREVERELQTARLKAVTANRPIRVRFNCPAAGQYRMVELIGTPSNPDLEDAETNLDRCGTADYAYPAADMNRLTLPNHDGPLRELHPTLEFSSGASKTLEFRPDGTVHQWATSATEVDWAVVPTTGTAVTVVKTGTTATASITVNGLGKVQIAQ